MNGNSEADRARNILIVGEKLAAEGKLSEAISLVTAENKHLQNRALERQLVLWRNQAFAWELHEGGRPEWPPVIEDPFPDCAGVPETQAGGLSGDLLGGAIVNHGCLLVRGLISAQDAAALRTGIDRAFAAYEEIEAGSAQPLHAGWYEPFPLGENFEMITGRAFTLESGGIWTAESPPVLFNLIELIKAKGIDRAIEEYFGERPALTVEK